MWAADWMDQNFKLAREASNNPGSWKTRPEQRAIANAFGDPRIPKVDFFKPTRCGGTKIAVGVHFYFLSNPASTGLYFMPTEDVLVKFVTSEVEPALALCREAYGKLKSKSQKSDLNNKHLKAFNNGAMAHYKPGGSSSSYEAISAQHVIMDEVDQYSTDVNSKGSPVVLSWARVRDHHFPKQILVSKPTVSGQSLIEHSSMQSDDFMTYHIPCPLCGVMSPLEWGGPDVPYGFTWSGRDPYSVLHVCKHCSGGWPHSMLRDVIEQGEYIGEQGWSTTDGKIWRLNGEERPPPRHVSFHTWSGYSMFWPKIVQEWYDCRGDISKIKTFKNNVLAQTFKDEQEATLSPEILGEIQRVDTLSDVTAMTCGIDVQSGANARFEVQYIGYDHNSNIYILDYDVIECDTSDYRSWEHLRRVVSEKRIQRGILPALGVCMAAIDTQGEGGATQICHRFLRDTRANGKAFGTIFEGVNGVNTKEYPVKSQPSHYEKKKPQRYWSIGTVLLKDTIMNRIIHHRGNAEGENALFVYDGARLPDNYAQQLTSERKVNTANGFKYVHKQHVRNEALDTFVYNLAARWLMINKHRAKARKLFGDKDVKFGRS